MAIDKLFQALVVGGVSMGVQACTPKKVQKKDPVESSQTAQEATPSSIKDQEVQRSPDQELRPLAEPAERDEPKWGMETNSKGEKCEDVCEQESSGEIICSEMCCWLQAVECCPDYRPPPEEEN